MNKQKKPGGGGGGHWTQFYARRLRHEVQPLTLLYTIFGRSQSTPFVLYAFYYWQMVPLAHTFKSSKFRTLHFFLLVLYMHRNLNMNNSLNQDVFLSFSLP